MQEVGMPVVYAFHTHPFTEQRLGIDQSHVIVDRDIYEIVLQYLQKQQVSVEQLIKSVPQST